MASSADQPPKNLPGQAGNTFGRWKPGQSGNPAGRPKSKPFKEALERQLAMLAKTKGLDAEQGHDVLAAAMIAKAMNGDVAAFKEVADRTDGKVPNPVGGTDELPPITAFAWRSPDPLPEAITQAIEEPQALKEST